MPARTSCFNLPALAWSAILVTSLSGCGARSALENDDAPDQPDSGDDAACSTEKPDESSNDSCVPLSAPAPETQFDDLQIEYACGLHTASAHVYSDFLAGGTPCAPDGINTFALRLTGSASARYSAVVRCGYIRYDNGTFVGERVEVEARDGQWCHEQALERIELVDRMLLTDVAFAIETLDACSPQRHLSVEFSTRAGWTEPAPTETNLCAYVAHRAPGYAACGLVPPASYCVCPCGGAWQDFFLAMKLSLAKG